MIDLYQINNQPPAELSSVLYDSNNMSYTAPYSQDTLTFLGIKFFGSYDPSTQYVHTNEDGSYAIKDLPPVITPEPPAPEPIVLGKLQFIGLCQQAGGMTDAMLVEAQKNPLFEAFWIKFQMASAVERDDPITLSSLQALAAGGYLPNGKDKVIEFWPTS